jgi:hypothetical protein
MLATAVIGQSDKSQKDVNITYPTPLGNVPAEFETSIVVVATVVLDAKSYSLSKYTDNYSVSVANITKTGFTARVTRLDASEDTGWGMNLKLNYTVNYSTITKGE